jgi:hypothetical protein
MLSRPHLPTQAITPLPDELRFIHIYGVDYYIPWEAMPPGSSVFLKTTAAAFEIRDQLARVNAHFGCRFAAHNRCEFGYYGIRIWRLT